jgi:uncharacterized delta-60 repeat protein
VAWLAIAVPAQASESLDPSFGEGGISFPGVGGASVRGLAEDAGGRLIGVGGGFESFVASRYRRDGSLDKSFGRDEGSVTNFFGFDSLAQAVALLPDGRIIEAGTGFSGTAILARYTPDGRLDRGFGKGGQARLSLGRRGGALDVALLPSGRILAAGYGLGQDYSWKAAVIAFRPNGRLDTRYNDDGLSAFTAEGGEASIELTAMQVLRGRGLLLAGEIGGRVMMVRLRADGDPDRSFGEGGFAYVNPGHCFCAQATGLTLDRRGRAVVSVDLAHGKREPAMLLRFRPDGRLDRSFGKGGVVRTFLGSHLRSKDVVVQRNGRIVLAGAYNVPGSGEARVAAVRYLPDGRVDRSFGRRGFFTRDFGVEGVAYTALLQRDGKVVIGGRANPARSPFFENASVFDTAQVFLARFLP